MRGKNSILGILTVFLLCTACDSNSDEIEPQPTADRTVLVYVAADNSLNSFSQEDYNELVKGAKQLPDNSHLLLFMDNMEGNSKLLRIDQKGSHTVKDYGEDLESTNPKVMEKVIREAETRYPAKGYGMVLWSHGTGWQSAQSRAFGQDTHARPMYEWMNIKDLASTLSKFPKFDYLMFDACFMQCVEVAYELRNTTRYIVAAPCEIPGPGAYYNILTPALFYENPAKTLVEYYYKPYLQDNPWGVKNDEGYGAVISTLDCAQVDAFTTLTRNLLPQRNGVALDFEQNEQHLQVYAGLYAKEYVSPYYDYKGLMQQLIPSPAFPEWEKALEKLIPYKGTTPWFFTSYEYPNADHIPVDPAKFSGLSGYIPDYFPGCEDWDEDFRQTDWYEAAGWKEKGW